jgi:hypothetical protein
LRFKPTSAGFYLFEERNDDSFDGSDLSFDDDEHKSDISSLTLDDSLSSLSSFEDIHSCPDSCVFHLSLCETQTERSCKHCHSVLSADTQVLHNPDSVSTMPLSVSADYDSDFLSTTCVSCSNTTLETAIYVEVGTRVPSPARALTNSSAMAHASRARPSFAPGRGGLVEGEGVNSESASELVPTHLYAGQDFRTSMAQPPVVGQTSCGTISFEQHCCCVRSRADIPDELCEQSSLVSDIAELHNSETENVVDSEVGSSSQISEISRSQSQSQSQRTRSRFMAGQGDILQRLSTLPPAPVQRFSAVVQGTIPRASLHNIGISGGGGTFREEAANVEEEAIPAPSLQESCCRNFVNGFSSHTLLLDIPIDKLGTLVGLQSSITFVPDNLKKPWSRCMAKYMDILRNDIENPMAWKKFFLVTTVVCSNSSPIMRKKVIREKIKLLLADNWNHFTLGSLSPKTPFSTSKPLVESSQQRAMKLAQVGEIGKALQVLVNAAPPIPATPDLFTRLMQKYPEAGACPLTPEQLQEMENFQLPDDVEPILVDRNKLVKIIKRTPSLKKPGFDMLRFEHLRQLIGPQIPERVDPDDDLFLDRYSRFLQSVINGDIPAEALPLFSDHETWVIPKGDSDFRPLGGVGVHRKLASSIALQDPSTQAFNKYFFKNLQFGMDRLGTEKIVHSFRIFLERHPESDVFAMDADNAFNRLCRLTALYEIMKAHPALFPLLYQMYKTSSNGWFHGLEEGIQPVHTSEGVTQGDTLGSWKYCVGTQQFLDGLSKLLADQHLLACFIDDTNVGADFETMLRVIKYVLEEGPKFGYHLKFTKGSYLMGRCGDHDEALRRKQALVDIGLSPAIIHLHPEDVPAAHREEAELAFGVRMVGTWIGHHRYIQGQLQSKLHDLNVEKEHIIAFPDPQIKNLMFRWCFCQKIDYLQRTTSPLLISNFVAQYDRMKQEIFCSLLQDIYTVDDLPPELWKRACLNIGDGGLGYRCVTDVTCSAYAASIIECSSLLDKIHPGFIATMENIHMSVGHCGLNVLEDFRACLNFIGAHSGNIQASVAWIHTLRHLDEAAAVAVDDYIVDKTLQALIGKGVRLKRAEEHLQFLLSKNDHHGIAWFKSCQGSHPGRWLQQSPKSPSTTLSPNEFSVMLLYRLRLEIPAIVPGSRCNGKSCGLVDRFGVHLTTGCGKGGFRHRTHDNVVLTIESLSRSCGVMTRREARRCFQTDLSSSERRPDLLLFNVPRHHQPVVADLMITGPVGTKALSLISALQEYRAANAAYGKKQTSYKDIASTNSLDFVALIFESTGKIHPETVRFLNSMLEACAGGDKFRLGSLKRFWFGLISFSLQKYLAQSLLARIQEISGRSTFKYNHEQMFIERAAKESERLHRE